MTETPETEPPTPHRRFRLLAWIGGLIGAVLLIAGVAAIFVGLPYVIVSPGPVTALDDDVVQIEGAPTDEHDGDLLLLTVSVSRQDPNVYRLLRAWLDDSRDVQPKDEVYGEEPPHDLRVLNTLSMEQSQIAAKTVALRELGYEVDAAPTGALVTGIVPDSAAQGELRLGDAITAIDGVATPTADAVGEAIRARRPGDEIVFTVERLPAPDETETEEREITVTAGEHDGQPLVGIALATEFELVDPPMDIRLDTREIGGPSGGLALTLAIIDELSAGDLTGGQDVAVTGTLALDGSVGPVGGVKQKTEAARRAGASLLLVPAGEVEEARRNGGSLRVVGVDSITEALQALVEAGGAPVEPPQSIAA